MKKAISKKTQVKAPAATAKAAVQPAPPQFSVPMRNAASNQAQGRAPGPVKSGKPAISLELVNPAAAQVYVAGTFNGWKPEATPLRRLENGRWVGNLSVTPGRYEYLFVVDGKWLPDPNAKESVQNPYGGQNSVLSVTE